MPKSISSARTTSTSTLRDSDTISFHSALSEAPLDDLVPGIYHIVKEDNPKIAIDLSAGDVKSVIGFPSHDRVNQKWELSKLGSGYSIRSVWSGGYLTIESFEEEPRAIVAKPFPVSWDIQRALHQDADVHEIRWPTPHTSACNYLFDLDLPRKRVQLVRRDVASVGSQGWRFTLLSATPHSSDPVQSPSNVNTTVNAHDLEDDEELLISTTTTITTTVKKKKKQQR